MSVGWLVSPSPGCVGTCTVYMLQTGPRVLNPQHIVPWRKCPRVRTVLSPLQLGYSRHRYFCSVSYSQSETPDLGEAKGCKITPTTTTSRRCHKATVSWWLFSLHLCLSRVLASQRRVPKLYPKPRSGVYPPSVRPRGGERHLYVSLPSGTDRMPRPP